LELAEACGVRWVFFLPFWDIATDCSHGLGSLLHLCLRRALPERQLQKDVFDAFSEQQVDNVESWRTMVEAYEADDTQPNPYEFPKSGSWVHLSTVDNQANMLWRSHRSWCSAAASTRGSWAGYSRDSCHPWCDFECLHFSWVGAGGTTVCMTRTSFL
jgi:hypothetical protein